MYLYSAPSFRVNCRLTDSDGPLDVGQKIRETRYSRAGQEVGRKLTEAVSAFRLFR